MDPNEDWLYFRGAIERETGMQLAGYKESHLLRRLGALRTRHGGGSWRELAVAIESDLELRQQVLDALTVNVSEFFRQPERYEELRTTTLPRLMALHSPLRIWSAGCSIGCEPYSLAILLEELDPTGMHRILATDVDAEALRRAREGRGYTRQEVRSVPAPLLERYFEREGDSYRVVDRLKKRVTFRRHDLARDPYPARVDLILCRNVVIYFTEEQKRHVYEGFAGALRPGGMLFVGGSELILRPRELGLQTAGTSFYVRAA